MIYIQMLEWFYSFRLYDHPQQLAMKSFSTLESLKTYLRPNDASWQTECTNPYLHISKYWNTVIFKSATFFRITFLNMNFMISNMIM